MNINRFIYLFGIVLENSFRLIKCFIPMILLTLVFPTLWKSYASAIIISLISMGGFFYEFKLTDYYKEQKEDEQN